MSRRQRRFPFLPLMLILVFSTFRACTARAAAARPFGPGPSRSDQLDISSISLDLSWREGARDGRELVLSIRLSLASPPRDWLQVSVQVPEGYTILDHLPGEWVPYYLLTHSPTAEIDIQLRPVDPGPSASRFPMLVQVGHRRAWTTLWLGSYPSGHAAACAFADASGRPVWFTSPEPDRRGAAGSFWLLMTNVSDALRFIADVLDVSIEVPGPLSPWCGMGLFTASAESLLEAICSCAGCVPERTGDGGFIVRFDETYLGAPDASWFVVRAGEEIRFHASEAPADDLLPALLAAAGESLGESPDLAASRVSHTWSGSLRSVVESACANAHPRLGWEVRDNRYRFWCRSE